MRRNIPKAIVLIFVCSAFSFARELYATIFYNGRPDYLLYDAFGAGYLFFVLQLPYLLVSGLALWLMLKPKIMALWYFFGQLYLAMLILTLYFVVAINNVELARETIIMSRLSRGRDASRDVAEMLVAPVGLKVFFVFAIFFLLALGAVFFWNRSYYLGGPRPFTMVDALEQLYERGIYALPVIDGGQQLLTKVETQFELSLFLDTYYLQPRPELVDEAIVTLGYTGMLEENEHAAPPLTGFFSEIFAANPGRLAEWRRLIKRQDRNTKSTLSYAVSLSKAGGVLSVNGHSPQMNDMYWGAFFASGNNNYVKKLIEQLRFIDQRTDMMLFMTAATAKWSLASNARTHDRVRSALETAQIDADDRTRELISEILTQDPDVIQREWQEVVVKQRAAGRWK